jgi:N-acetylmuramoyl-L-alanine amidase
MKLLKGKNNLFILILGLSSLTLNAQNKIKHITIDAGHGGKDPGALGLSGKEKDVTLGVSLKLGKLINAMYPEITTEFTRTEDEFIELYQRSNKANKAHSDLFISIHCNSNAKKDVCGSEFYVLGLHKADDNLEVAKKENSVVLLESDVSNNYGFDPNSPEGNIIMTMQQNVYMDKSILFAKELEKVFEKYANPNVCIQKNRGTKQAGFVVLYKSTMPSVLIEIGFISNPEEEKILVSEDGQLKIAEKIAEAFKNFKVKYELSLHEADLVVKDKEKNKNKQLAIETTTTPSNKITTTIPIQVIESPKTDEKIKEIIVDSVNKTTVVVFEKTPTKLSVEDGYKRDIDVSYRKDMINKSNNTSLNTNGVKYEIAKATTKSTSAMMTAAAVIDARKNSENNIEYRNNTDNAAINNLINQNIASGSKEINQVKPTTSKINSKTELNELLNSKINQLANKNLPNPEQEILTYAPDDIKKPGAEENTFEYHTSKFEEEKIAPNENVYFSIQLFASKQKITRQMPVDVVERLENGYYKYTVGKYFNKYEAEKRMQELKFNGYQDCFILKFVNGIRQF